MHNTFWKGDAAMLARWIGLLALVLVGLAGQAGASPWDMAVLGEAPAVVNAEGFAEPGCRAVFYAGPPLGGRATQVFAWLGVPEGTPPAGGWPGMVLVHGGGGTAFAEWVRLWTGRGYAAIAMDTCGAVPRGSYGKWERNPQGGPPGWGAFEMAEAPVGDQWPFHAVADVILGHSLLRAQPGVDPARIGLTGISWGGYLTCIVSGVDARFRLAVPVYGCGFLGEDSAWVEAFAKLPPATAQRWLSLWDPSVYLPDAALPMLWVTGTNDFAYPMNSLQKSYRLPKGPRTLAIRPRMPHGHGGAGENPAEILAFADQVLRGGAPLPRITGQGQGDGGAVWATYDPATPVARAVLEYTTTGGAWKDRVWESIPATVEAGAGRVTAVLPAGVMVYYLNLFDAEERVVSTEHAVVDGKI